MAAALTGIVDGYAGRINFGLAPYPADNECAPGRVQVDMAATGRARSPPHCGSRFPTAAHRPI
jgi:hypothetical protein